MEVPIQRHGLHELRPVRKGSIRLVSLSTSQLCTDNLLAPLQYSGDDGSWGYLAGSSQYTDGWQHIACRTYDMSKGEFGPDRRDNVNLSNAGVVTTIHLTDLGIEGELATSALHRASRERLRRSLFLLSIPG